jgi:hypothetical protein
MLISAIILFLVAAIFGLILLPAILQDIPTPKPAILLHGSFAALALLLIVIYILIYGADPLLITSLILFIIAALGGITLVTLDIKKKPIPKLLAIIHPLIAAAGLVVLIIYVLP